MILYPYFYNNYYYLATARPVIVNDYISNYNESNFNTVLLRDEFIELGDTNKVELIETPTNYKVYVAKDLDGSVYLFFKNPVYDESTDEYYYSLEDNYLECLYIPADCSTDKIKHIIPGDCKIFYLKILHDGQAINIF